jgi:hypothetical protein
MISRNLRHLARPLRCQCDCSADSTRIRYLEFASALVILFSLASAAPTAEAASEARQDAWVVQASAGLAPALIDALHRIVGVDRRLLALRAYLRAGDALSERWSWTQERLSAYPSTPEGKAAAIEINAVAAAFATTNPGFTLQVNRQPRSLDVQIAHWNENESVGKTAAMLRAALERRFTANGTPLNADELRKALIEWPAGAAAALAAPGLSAHGQGRAFDFQVAHHGQVIAGADVASAHRQWDAAGWTQKLHAAVSIAGNRFVGPLQSPYEPWHYAYAPVPMTSDRKAP